MPTAEQRRRDMVERQIAGRGITDPQVLAAMGEVPRDAFVAAELAELAYDDSPLPIGFGQTISQPYIVALMIEAAGIGPGDAALEIGAGSGYAAAIASRIACRVHAIERHQELADSASQRLARLGYDNVSIRCGDGSQGWPEEAPFDAILVAAGSPAVPQPLCAQLAIGGRLVVPVGTAEFQRLIRVTRRGEDEFETRNLGGVRFVPLIGAHGWAGGLGADGL